MADFYETAPRKLPVFILADISASMKAPLGDGREGRRIDALNRGVRNLIKACAEVDNAREPVEVEVAVITFGNGQAVQSLELTAAANAHWSDVAADGDTPLGKALDVAADLIEDRSYVTRRHYRPVLVLCSDGQPTDDWMPALERLNAGRAGQADRFAAAIGAEADRDMLRAFLGAALKSGVAVGKLFEAGTEDQMRKFFELVSIVSTKRASSVRPNESVPADALNIDGL